MKLVVQIPCLNEAKTLPLVLKTIPKKIAGIDSIDILIIDDGSSDDTIQVAKRLGVKHFVRHTTNIGLGWSFRDGVLRALELGADIVVNTDGDNQYPQQSIPQLIKPILNGQADIVVADRQVSKIPHFSVIKKLLQKLGSRVVNIAAGTNVPDAPSGFRAYSRQALLKLNTTARFSYTMESLIQAGSKGLAITSVPITTNPKTRDSRLFKSNLEHIVKSGVIILRSYIMYRPYVLFVSLGGLLFVGGIIPFARFAWFFYEGARGQHIQSLVVGSTLLFGSLLCFALGVIADLIRINRSLLDDQLELNKRTHLATHKPRRPTNQPRKS
jgi:glycosyltransferase involved in cell wall biosynthesis